MKYSIGYRLLVIPGILPFVMSPVGYAVAREHFNPALLEMSGVSSTAIDLTRFELGEQIPGKYRVDIYINNAMVDTEEVVFTHGVGNDGKDTLVPCLSIEQLRGWGIKVENYPELSTKGENTQCANLSAIPQFLSDFKFNIQRLNLSIPQIALAFNPKDYIAPEKWDEGINAFLFNYSFSGTTTVPRSSGMQTENSQYGNFHPGLNIGAWRFRNYSTWNHNTTGQNTWDSVYNYVSRDIKFLKSQLVIGDSNSSSDVFDSVAFRGGQLASDDEMTPDSLKGYSPVIRGIAKTNAEVTVYQNGHSIYKTSVAPGAFEINDMYATGGAGDMQVTIKESDGSEQHLIVPYASLPVLQREGHVKYSVTAGQTRSSGEKQADFGQLTAIYGLPYGITAYGGVQGANIDYTSASLGLGINLGSIGALSSDVTQSWATINNGTGDRGSKGSGQSLRVRYSKNIITTGTNFTVAGYRYSTKGYYSLQDTLDTWDGNEGGHTGRRRNRTELSLSQDVIYGAVSASYINENYWDRSRMSSVSLGYNNNWESISYGFSYTYSLNASDDNTGGTSDNDQQFSFNVSIPLEKFLPSASVSYNMSSSKNGPSTYNVGVSGVTLENRNLSWNAQEGYTDANHKTNGSLSADYKGRYSEVNAGYSYDENADRLNYGMQGGVLVHGNGITLSQPFNDTVVLVNTSGAEGVVVNNQPGIKTDAKGFAVVPYANPYHNNNIVLDTESLDSNTIDLQETSKKVIPTRGAVVVANYSTNIGYRALFSLTLPQGKPVPFGASVNIETDETDPDKLHTGIVGDDGQAYVTGLEDKGRLLVKWGAGNNDQCIVDYTLPVVKSPSGVEVLRAECH
jgi:outer membrane usher protein